MRFVNFAIRVYTQEDVIDSVLFFVVFSSSVSPWTAPLQAKISSGIVLHQYNCDESRIKIRH